MSALVLLAVSTAFHPPASTLSASTLSAAARTGPPRALSISHVAAGANLATFGVYGAALVLKPAALMKDVMKSDTQWTLGDVPYVIAQYLGAVYLSQALRMVRALTVAAMLKSDLMGVCIIQLFLCATSLARLAAGVDRNAVTLTLPAGQGFMAALSWVGYASA
jgi:hypothetical protein